MRLRRYEIAPNVRERYIMASLDCAQQAAKLARDECTDGDLVVQYTEAAQKLLSMGELHIEVDVIPEVCFTKDED